MPGKILIVDSTATNRIVLKVKLSGAFYQVEQAASTEEAQSMIAAAPPDLVILGEGATGAGPLDLCRQIKANPRHVHMPVLVVGAAASSRMRLAALKAGVDDVLEHPVEDAFLLARIRSLLRNHDMIEEMRLRGGTARMLGFAEAQPEFTAQANILFATPCAQTGLNWRNALKPLLPFTLHHQAICDAMRSLTKAPAPDAVVILPDPNATDESLRLLAELRARRDSRRAAILFVTGGNDTEILIDALDLGADDVMLNGFDAEEIAARLSSLVQRKRHVDRLRRDVQTGLTAAIVDPLTGLFNRRYATPQLAGIVDRALSGGHADCAVMVADLDHFKQINDRYGHATGDEVLVEVARRLRSSLGPKDLVARLGGEEFLIALPSTTVEHAHEVARHLCQRIGGQPVHLKRKNLSVRVTVSIGVAMGQQIAETRPRDDETLSAAILDRADRALYGAKSHGRNRVIVSCPAA